MGLFLLGASLEDNHHNTVKIEAGPCAGSGIPVKQGILTAAHVVLEDPEHIKVISIEGVSSDAILIELDLNNDLALLKVDKYFGEMEVAEDTPEIGDPIYLVGNGLLIPNMYKKGYVSGFISNLMLSDCMSLPGDSGCGVFNEDDELVGVHDCRIMGPEGQDGFEGSIKLEIVKEFLED